MYKVMPLPSTRKVPSVPLVVPTCAAPAAATAEPAEDDLLDTAAPAELAAEDALLDAADAAELNGAVELVALADEDAAGVEDELQAATSIAAPANTAAKLPTARWLFGPNMRTPFGSASARSRPQRFVHCSGERHHPWNGSEVRPGSREWTKGRVRRSAGSPV